jgi:hypothetical protein
MVLMAGPRPLHTRILLDAFEPYPKNPVRPTAAESKIANLPMLRGIPSKGAGEIRRARALDARERKIQNEHHQPELHHIQVIPMATINVLKERLQDLMADALPRHSRYGRKDGDGAHQLAKKFHTHSRVRVVV